MKILAISDTHTMHKGVEKKFPDLFQRDDIDVIVHAGDISSRGNEWEVKSFLDWYSNLYQFKERIFIAGNHDIGFEKHPIQFRGFVPSNVIYLEDSGVEIDGVEFWGSPVTPPFSNWAFMRNEEEIKKHWDMIPDDVDVLITHGPAHSVGDFVSNHFGVGHTGCKELVRAIHRTNPSYHIYGHIHEGYGAYRLFDTISLNVSSLNGIYRCTNEPVLFEI